MPKYKCKVSATTEFEIDVEADDEESAVEEACAQVNAEHWVDTRNYDCWDVREVKENANQNVSA